MPHLTYKGITPYQLINFNANEDEAGQQFLVHGSQIILLQILSLIAQILVIASDSEATQCCTPNPWVASLSLAMTHI